MEQILRSYFPNATADCVYKVFTQWAGLGYDSWIFFRSKTHWSHQIFLKYRPFKRAVDNLLPALNGLVLGTKTKPECQVLGASAVKLQEVKNIYNYFILDKQFHSNLNTRHAKTS